MGGWRCGESRPPPAGTEDEGGVWRRMEEEDGRGAPLRLDEFQSQLQRIDALRKSGRMHETETTRGPRRCKLAKSALGYLQP
jgi:hypothetical protein